MRVTQLVDDAFLKTVRGKRRDGQPTEWKHRGHFYQFAANKMNWLLLDELKRQKRQLLAVLRKYATSQLREALTRIEKLIDQLTLLESQTAAWDSNLADVFRMHYFLECEVDEITKMTGLEAAEVRKLLRQADALLANLFSRR
jgi:DNA-directed RNA polymerase specialized sigma24 family protein